MTERPAGEGLTVLVVDDEDDAADSLATLVGLWGHRSLLARRGEDALRLAAEHRPDVAVLDLGLPDMTGWELARRLRGLPGLRRALLVAVSGSGFPEDYEKSYEAGFAVHFLKPTDPELLRLLLESRRPREDST